MMRRRPPSSTLFPYTTLFRSFKELPVGREERRTVHRSRAGHRHPGQRIGPGTNTLAGVTVPGATPVNGAPFFSPDWKLLERSEERRVGKECRARWSPPHHNNKNDTAVQRLTLITTSPP